MTHLTIPDQEAAITYPSATGAGPYNVTFPITSSLDLRVTVGGVELPASAFTFTPTTVVTGGYQSGYITLATAAAAQDVVIWRDIPLVRDTDFSQGPLDMDALNSALDRLTAQVQDARQPLNGGSVATSVNISSYGVGWLRQYGGQDSLTVDSGPALVELWNDIAAEVISSGAAEVGQYRIDATAQCTAPIIFNGSGGAFGPGAVLNSNCTQFMLNFTSGHGLDFVGLYGPQVGDFQINNNTAGRVSDAGLAFRGSGGMMAGARATNVSTSGMYDGIALEDVAYPIIDGGYDQAWVRSAIRHRVVSGAENSVGFIRDRYMFGDATPGTTQESCVHFEGGYGQWSGGLALGAKKGFNCAIPAGYAAGNVEIHGTTAEENDVVSYDFSCGAGGSLTMLRMEGPEWSSAVTRTNYVAGIRFQDNGSDWLSDFVISNARGRQKMVTNNTAMMEIATGSDGVIANGVLELLSGSSATAYGIRVGAQAKRILISGMRLVGFTTPYVLTTQVTLIDTHTGLTVAQAPTCRDGSLAWFSDGTPGSSPLTGGATGCLALRRDGAWHALLGGADKASAAQVRAMTSTATLLTPESLTQRASFKAHKNGTDQTGIANSTWTKITFGTEVWDTGAAYDSATNHRWTPPAGKVRIAAQINVSAGASASNVQRVAIYKNGSLFAVGTPDFCSTGSVVRPRVDVTDTANGTDYYEVWAFLISGGTLTVAGATTDSWFEGHQI